MKPIKFNLIAMRDEGYYQVEFDRPGMSNLSLHPGDHHRHCIEDHFDEAFPGTDWAVENMEDGLATDSSYVSDRHPHPVPETGKSAADCAAKRCRARRDSSFPPCRAA